MTYQALSKTTWHLKSNVIFQEERESVNNALLYPVIADKDIRFENVDTLIVKVTHRCNLDCLYCYENITKGNDMPLAVFKALADKAISSTQKNKLMFIFHGGEPTLLSQEWFIEAVNYARSKADALDKQVGFSIQTNLIGLDKQKLCLFRDLDIKVSASLDGFSSISNPMRQRAEVAIENYRRAIALGIKVGVLTTINHANFDKFRDICNGFEHELNIHEFKANVASSVGRGINLPELDPEQIFLAYHDILEYMIDTKGMGVIENNLSLELIRFFATPEERVQMPLEMCRTQHCGAGKSVVGVTSDGKLLPCGRFQWDDAPYFLGSLNDSDIADFGLAYSKAVEKFHALIPENWYDCSTCKASRVCSYGCQAFTVRSKKRANIDCVPTKMRFDYYERNFQRLEPIMLLLKQRFNNYQAMGYKDGSDYNDFYNDKTYNDYSDRAR